MGNRSLVEPGDVLIAALARQVPTGREQVGTRPVIVVAVPPEPVRYPVVIVVPVTSQEGPWSRENPLVYPSLNPGAGGLPVRSTVLLDQVRSLDVQRILEYIGTLDAVDSGRVRSGLRELMNL